jgi:hypothetical protein
MGIQNFMLEKSIKRGKNNPQKGSAMASKNREKS